MVQIHIRMSNNFLSYEKTLAYCLIVMAKLRFLPFVIKKNES
jgi:hypothetical protein